MKALFLLFRARFPTTKRYIIYCQYESVMKNTRHRKLKINCRPSHVKKNEISARESKMVYDPVVRLQTNHNSVSLSFFPVRKYQRETFIQSCSGSRHSCIARELSLNELLTLTELQTKLASANPRLKTFSILP